MKQLNVEQDELNACEQQMLNAVEELDGDDDDERTRQNLNDILAKNPTNGQVSPAKEPALPNPTNEQLQAKLDHMRTQWEVDRQALEEANQQLAEEEGARQEEARERIHYRNANEKLVTQLDNFKSVLSTLQERDELIDNPSA